jgi:hypothetical protein
MEHEKAMNVSFPVLSLLLGVLVIVTGSLWYHYSSAVITEAPTSVQSSQVPLRAAVVQGSPPTNLSTPLPPPRPPGSINPQATVERELTLVGITTEELKRIQGYLPSGSEIVTYPISRNELRAAADSADLDNDGNVETVVVYRNSELDRTKITTLYLAVLGVMQGRLEVRATQPLSGTYIQNTVSDIKAVPIALRDVTGVHHKEILVTSSMGASLGSVLQILSFQNSSLHQIANISGDTIEVESVGAGKPSLITARSRNEKEPNTYRWNGEEFKL